VAKIKDCDLVERVNWIKDAVRGKDLGLQQLTSFYIHEGMLHASDGRMVVATPFPADGIGTALVPAEPFIRVLENRPQGDFEWLREDDRLVLKRGRFKGKVKLLDATQWCYPALGSAGVFLPDGLVKGLRGLLPFVSENATKPWATCLLLKGSFLYASNNIVVARAKLPDVHEEVLIPSWLAEFVVDRSDNLEWWTAEPGKFVTFGWEDGSWCRSSLINDQFPPVEQAIETMYFDPELLVEKPWRDAILRVARITGDPVIRLRPDGVYGAGGETILVEDDAGTPVPEGLLETVWDIRFLEPVLDVATAWDPRAYPKPAPFKADGIQGVVMGRRD
jgi:hypothetical protein